ncbi:MAG: hypothetical protein K1Y36_30005 [Blastocatellia bacterium]|nr:hypothetical protein [Blastocatellia bacterium]
MPIFLFVGGTLFNRLTPSLRGKLFWFHHSLYLLFGAGLTFVLLSFSTELAHPTVDDRAVLVCEVFQAQPALLRRVPPLADFEFLEGTSDGLELPPEVLAWFQAHPDEVWRKQTPTRLTLVRRSQEPGIWQKVTFDRLANVRKVRKFQLNLGIVIGILFLGTVLVVEVWILPRFVYQPLEQLLAADQALQTGDQARELVPERFFPSDELGRIMASRNETVRRLRAREAELTGLLAQLQEISGELKRKNELLELTKRNLADQGRLLSLGLMSAGIAHELNTPLVVLQGTLEKLLESEADALRQERLRRALRVTTRLQALSESLTDFARARMDAKAPVSLPDVLREAWEMVLVTPRASQVANTWNLQGDEVVLGNHDRLLQVFVNLFHNALQAMDFQGSLTVAGETRATAQGPVVVIQVADSGPGIAPELIPHIFEPFVTTRLDARGTGLGLAVAEGIVHQHQGTITAANQPDGGACFEIVLPAVPDGLPPERTD